MAISAVPVGGPEAGLGRTFVVGSIIGAVLVFVFFLVVLTAAGVSPAAAIGVGSFTAFWGGPGFGGMMGAILHHTRHDHS